jgi:hypothetical protein
MGNDRHTGSSLPGEGQRTGGENQSLTLRESRDLSGKWWERRVDESGLKVITVADIIEKPVSTISEMKSGIKNVGLHDYIALIDVNQDAARGALQDLRALAFRRNDLALTGDMARVLVKTRARLRMAGRVAWEIAGSAIAESLATTLDVLDVALDFHEAE